MHYALLIYSAEPTEAIPEDLMLAEMAGYDAFTEHLRERGASCRPARRCYPTATATTVRVRDGRTLTTDGPFAETKEALGGFYLVEAADLDEAIALAAHDPGRHARLDRGPADLRASEHGGRGAPRRPPRELTRPAVERLAEPDAAHEVVDRLFREESGTGGRDPDPGPRRLRPRRGGRPGGLRHGARDLAGARRPGQPGGLDHDDRAQPGDRPAPPARAVRARRPRHARPRCGDRGRAPRGDRCPAAAEDLMPIADDRAAPDLHVLPSGAGDGRAGRADPAHARRPDDARDRPRLPRPRADARPAAGPGQAQDPRRRDPLPRPARRAAARAARRRAARPLPRLQRGLRGDVGRCARSGASCARRRSGWPGSSSRCSPTSRRRPGCWR